MLFSTVTAPFWIPVNGAQGLQFLYILANTCLLLLLPLSPVTTISSTMTTTTTTTTSMAILTGVRRYLNVVLICICLMIVDIEILFIYLKFTCMPSLEKCLFRTLAHFKIRLSGFLLLSFRSSLYIFSYCSWGFQGKNAEVVCYTSLQWTTFCQALTIRDMTFSQQQYVLEILMLYQKYNLYIFFPIA